MEQLLNMNPGFASRISFHIDFEDYTPEQLYTIFKKMAKKEKYSVDPNVKTTLIQYFKDAIKQDDFSNARQVRNIFEHTKIEQANRIILDEAANKDMIKKIDLENVLKDMKPKQEARKIGFAI